MQVCICCITKQLLVNLWYNNVIHCYNYLSLADYVIYISRRMNCYCVKHLVCNDFLLGKLTTWATRLAYQGNNL
jgi:hypothetical protein